VSLTTTPTFSLSLSLSLSLSRHLWEWCSVWAMGWMTRGQKFSYPKRPYRLWRPDSLSHDGSLVLGVNQPRRENERQRGSTIIALVPLPYYFIVW
jgi:hypothetical protein